MHSVQVNFLLWTILKEQSEEIEQETFESQCKLRISQFFKKFRSETRRFNAEDKDRVREARKWTDHENYVVQETNKDETSKVFVR